MGEVGDTARAGVLEVTGSGTLNPESAVALVDAGASDT
jgi:hypothetical protein